jgi:putative endonuclease
MNRRIRGTDGENEAQAYLESQGYSVLARNFRTRRGEVDLVARRGGRLAFVEVKNWGSYQADSLEYAIGAWKRRRIIEVSRSYLRLHPQPDGVRIAYDVILLRRGRINHIQDAFPGV